MGKHRVTLTDVAEMAGVSRGTVDRVLKERPHVRPEVRDRVNAALISSGYLRGRTMASVPPESLIRLGVIRPDWSGQFRVEVARGIRQAVNELAGARVHVEERICVEEDPEEILAHIDELEKSGISGLSICAPDDPLIRERIDRLEDAGIRTITFNSDLSHCRRTAFVGQSHWQSGRVAASVLDKCIPEDCRVLVACGNLEFAAHKERLGGFLEHMRERGRSTDNYLQISTFNDYQITYRKIMTSMRENPDIGAVYMANESVPAFVRAMRDLGISHRIPSLCHDLSEAAAGFLKEGSIDFVISQDLYRQGYLPLRMLQDIIQNKDPLDYLGTGSMIQIFCSENFIS